MKVYNFRVWQQMKSSTGKIDTKSQYVSEQVCKKYDIVRDLTLTAIWFMRGEGAPHILTGDQATYATCSTLQQDFLDTFRSSHTFEVFRVTLHFTRYMSVRSTSVTHVQHASTWSPCMAGILILYQFDTLVCFLKQQSLCVNNNFAMDINWTFKVSEINMSI